MKMPKETYTDQEIEKVRLKLIGYLQKYCHRRCHVLIFKEKNPSNGLEFVKRIENYNEPKS